ncbi:sugar phosphate nucleotidyltransferase [Candidatus Xianfuyuplasma coldseepsis]|uniref:Glucose-1-phosphate adenylyltransferase n=1 Tax=Candidatus Xianfuyuplasma coldseepsis TaxID=2782163 RepID=A0A7L7KU90_9MOLU|nr:sugar phosphate nucleotidyltransferase [Xianfuyuplasma coldseepsis]QMS85816.1 NTP transferase domain-containing protein [Xianfuyuplasma coldseepsis]
METLALILAGGRGSRLDILTEKRVKPAVPFAGKFRIIDFALSNCTNSGIYDIAILTQYLPLSLNEHIGVGKPWDLDRRDSSLTLLQPHKEWYSGTADAVLQNINFIKRRNPKYVLILSGDHIYKMNYQKMIDFHIENNSKCTIAVQPVAWEDAHRFGILTSDEHHKITRFDEKPAKPESNLASMGIYVFDTDVLLDAITTVEDPNLDFGKHIIPHLLETEDLYTYVFDDYWKDVGTFDSYVEANIELTNTVDKIPLDMYDRSWRIYTKSEELPSVKVGSKALISQALLSNGCIVAGTVKQSVLSPGVIIHPGATVINSVILNDTEIKPGAYIEHSIIDKRCVIEENVIIGDGSDLTPNKDNPKLMSSGVNAVAANVKIPAGTVITRNCRIFSSATFTDKIIEPGSTLR